MKQETTDQVVSIPSLAFTAATDQDEVMRTLQSALVGVFWHGPDRSRRRTFFTLRAAERAVRRARARGTEAHLVVCELTPLHEIDIPAQVPR